MRMSWRCHIFRREAKEFTGDGRYFFGIHEGFYDRTGMWGWSKETERLEAESPEELIEYIEMILADIKKNPTVYDHETGKPI